MFRPAFQVAIHFPKQGREDFDGALSHASQGLTKACGGFTIIFSRPVTALTRGPSKHGIHAYV
ncbi:MAG TPA: hypothetical protein ENN39_10575 [Desulfonatronum sp.]|nr:hypothetical protein [Desulfonatronum sp.]